MSRPADTAARSSIRAKPAVVNGAPSSETNTNGDGGASRGHRMAELLLQFSGRSQFFCRAASSTNLSCSMAVV